MYVGGTASIPEKTEGELNASDEKALTFSSKKGSLTIPYSQVTSLEYGQKVGRRVGVAIAVTWFALFSKKRKHFLTIGYSDEEGAGARELRHKVPPGEIERRRKKLMQIQRQISRRNKQRLVGQELELLVEGPSAETARCE